MYKYVFVVLCVCEQLSLRFIHYVYDVCNIIQRKSLKSLSHACISASYVCRRYEL